eukprot:68922-Rhodomonas_salina.1
MTRRTLLAMWANHIMKVNCEFSTTLLWHTMRRYTREMRMKTGPSKRREGESACAFTARTQNASSRIVTVKE